MRNIQFCLPDDFDLSEYTRHSFKAMQDELHTVKVRITPAWARYIGEKIWDESQRSRKLGDGSLELTFHVAGFDEIKQWIMGFGSEAYVEEPEIEVKRYGKNFCTRRKNRRS